MINQLLNCSKIQKIGLSLGTARGMVVWGWNWVPNVFVSGNVVEESARPCGFVHRAWEKEEAQGVQCQCSSKSLAKSCIVLFPNRTSAAADVHHCMPSAVSPPCILDPDVDKTQSSRYRHRGDPHHFMLNFSSNGVSDHLPVALMKE